MNLNSAFSISEFSEWLRVSISDYTNNIQPIDIKDPDILKAETLGVSDNLNIRIFVIKTTADVTKKKVGLAKSSFAFLKRYAVSNAIVAYYSDNSDIWRLSLLTSSPVWSENKVIIKVSNPRRFSYLLGKSAKTNTPQKYLISKGPIKDLEDLKSRFSLEVVNKEFYKAISQSFTKLIADQLKLPSISETNKISLEFAVRLIGRTIFCWFLREKVSDKGDSLMPKDLLSRSALDSHKDYYHSVLEPIFFEVLNKSMPTRLDDFKLIPFNSIPYLNGGLFSPQDDDYYSRNKNDFQSKYHNTLVIPDEWFKDFFDTLETYNFTIDENTSFDEELSIDPEMLGRIFENLLAEINPETGESARKSTGSYYTPRIIVNYMVDESLLLYLQEKTKISGDKLRALISYDLSDDTEHPLNSNEQELVVLALEQVKILDPACGSGAFPMGALQKIVFILEQIDPNGQIWFKKQISNVSPEIKRVMEKEFANKNFDYIRKLNIIRENIYGIDIQPIATEISRLRCFLTLVVDQQIHEDQENRGIAPLPNLDFKFVTANSLVGLPKIENISQQNMFDNYESINDLKEIRNDYFNSSGIEREQLKTQFVMQQKRLVDQLIKEHGFIGVSKAELTQRLTDWEPFTHKATSWFDSEWMYGIKEGFDIILGNPPYIKEYVNKSAFDLIRKSKYYMGKMDIWYMFSCVCMDYLSENGIESLIAQNNWTTSAGAKIMRNKITAEAKIVNLTDFGDYKIFENAGIQTMIMIFQKNKYINNYIFDYRRILKGELTSQLIIDILSKNINPNIEYLKPTFDRDYYKNNFFNFSSENLGMILNHVSNVSNLKLDSKSEVAQGIVYPQDRVNKKASEVLQGKHKVGEGIFVLSEEEKILKNFSNKELSYLKPSYTTKEIHRWYADSNNKEWAIYTDSTFRNINKAAEFPSMKTHLDQFKQIITSDNGPYGLHRARDEKFFLGNKIVVARKCLIPTFSYVDFDSYVSATFYVIKTDRVDMLYLTGLLNSKLIQFWLKYRGKMQGNNYQIDKEPIIALPLLNPSQHDQETISNIVRRIIKTKKLDPKLSVLSLEKDMNLLIYKLYGLGENEINTIEEDLST